MFLFFSTTGLGRQQNDVINDNTPNLEIDKEFKVNLNDFNSMLQALRLAAQRLAIISKQ